MTEPDERMDRRLRNTGARWRDALPAGADRFVGASPPRRRGLMPAAAAVAVVAVVGVTFAVTNGEDERAPVPPGGLPSDGDLPSESSLPSDGGIPTASGFPTSSGGVNPDLPNGTLTGLVTIDNGSGLATSRPVRGGVLQAEGKPGIFTTTIGNDGSYELVLPAGAYQLNITTSRRLSGFNCHDRVGVTGGAVNTADISCPM